MDIAENSLFLSISRILWAFRIGRAKDAAGNELAPPDPDDIMGGLAAMPAPFQADIVPRSAKRAETVRSAWKAEQGNLNEDDGQWNHVPGGLPYAKVKVKA